ncbi:MAG: indole-3-glycerol phosphate synthase TrpC [Thermodesulfovibrionales bacterium]
MSVLNVIVEKKRERLVYAKSKVPLHDLKARIPDMEKPLDFRAAIKRGEGNIRLIAEIKKASPSKGVIREDFDLQKIAEIYEEKAVNAVSVLTEEDFFQGHLNNIVSVKKILTRPVLRKDFIFDEYQIYESRAYGADAVLLIASILERIQAEEYLHLCSELGLSVVFEVHNFDELEKALYLDAGIIGINNRDLKTLKVDLNTTFLLKQEIPPDRVIVSESGIRTRGDVLRLEAAGIDAVLVGTALIESSDIGKKIDELRGSEGEQK